VIKEKWLLFKFRHGCQDAFCQLFEAYRDDLLRVAMSLLQDKSVAEDIVHEVFMHLIQVRKTFELSGSLKGYLAICVANRARNVNRDSRRMHSLDAGQGVERMSGLRRPDQWAVCSEEFERLRTALLTLPYAQREVVTLRVQGQLTFREMAENQGCSMKTVQSRYRYALDKLREQLNGEVSS
jgi:RNA polymerase sigma-70 factor, ECF subfamily